MVISNGVNSMDAKKDRFARFDELGNRVAKQHERMRALMQMSDDLMCEASDAGYFLWLNDKWHKHLGWSIQELLEKQWLDFVHKDDREKTIAASEEMKKADLINFENRYICKDGQFKRILWKCLKWNGGGTTLCIARVIED